MGNNLITTTNTNANAVTGVQYELSPITSGPNGPQSIFAAANKDTTFSIPIEGLGIQMIDERNKRGRPPKKPKPPEVEQREKQLLQQKIIA